MLSAFTVRQLMIREVRAFLGHPWWLEVTDWKPGTGAVLTDRRSGKQACANQPQQPAPRVSRGRARG
jgi:hypothetical protein